MNRPLALRLALPILLTGGVGLFWLLSPATIDPTAELERQRKELFALPRWSPNTGRIVAFEGDKVGFANMPSVRRLASAGAREAAVLLANAGYVSERDMPPSDPFVRAFRLVARDPSALPVFRDMARNGTQPGRIHGLCGLYVSSGTDFEDRLAAGLREVSEPADWMGACVGRHFSGEVLRGEMSSGKLCAHLLGLLPVGERTPRFPPCP